MGRAWGWDSRQRLVSREGPQWPGSHCHPTPSLLLRLVPLPAGGGDQVPVSRRGQQWQGASLLSVPPPHRGTTSSTTASWSSMEPTPWPLPPPCSPLCWKTCRKLSSLLVLR